MKKDFNKNVFSHLTHSHPVLFKKQEALWAAASTKTLLWHLMATAVSHSSALTLTLSHIPEIKQQLHLFTVSRLFWHNNLDE